MRAWGSSRVLKATCQVRLAYVSQPRLFKESEWREMLFGKGGAPQYIMISSSGSQGSIIRMYSSKSKRICEKE